MASTTLALTPAGLVSPLKELSSCKSAFSSSSSRALALPASKARFTCSAEASPAEPASSKAGPKLATALALAAVLGTAPLACCPQNALADVAGLTPCKESKAFAKREDKALKKLNKRLEKYAPDSAPALAINATIEKTKRRFDFYGSQGLLCGADGLPHLIVDGDQAHLGEFVYPGIIFLYIAGWIGWVGRSYLIAIKASGKKPAEKEIIIDVPLASRLMWRGFVWPLAAVSEFRNGKLIEDAANITVSPR